MWWLINYKGSCVRFPCRLKDMVVFKGKFVFLGPNIMLQNHVEISAFIFTPFSLDWFWHLNSKAAFRLTLNGWTPTHGKQGLVFVSESYTQSSCCFLQPVQRYWVNMTECLVVNWINLSSLRLFPLKNACGLMSAPAEWSSMTKTSQNSLISCRNFTYPALTHY